MEYGLIHGRPRICRTKFCRTRYLSSLHPKGLFINYDIIKRDLINLCLPQQRLAISLYNIAKNVFIVAVCFEELMRSYILGVRMRMISLSPPLSAPES